MNYIDLFSGIGGFALGAYWAGMKFENHYFSEVEPYAVEVYQKRFPDSIPLGDIREIDCERLLADTECKRRRENPETRLEMEQNALDRRQWEEDPNTLETRSDAWIITGGFPCQDISVAGKGAGIEGNRSGLWSEYWRIIREIRPRYAIIENVAALTFRGLDRVLSDLAEIGYDAEWQDIRAEDVGAPHRRERIWIMAYPNGAGCKERRRAEPIRAEQPASQHVCEEVSDTTSRGEQPGGTQRNERGFQDENVRGMGDTDYWAIEPDVGRLAHGVPHRVDRLKGDGNAIVPEIAELLFRQIKDD